MPARIALPTDLRAASRHLEIALRSPDQIVASVLPPPLAEGALAHWPRLLPGLLGLGRHVRLFVEDRRGVLRSVALVYCGGRAEWVVLILSGAADPDGGDSVVRLLAFISTCAAQAGRHRLFGAVPDAGGPNGLGSARAKETFFQGGFYSYTRETWFVAPQAVLPDAILPAARIAHSRDAHDLFRFYAMTTPSSVQRAEQLTVEDFDVDRRAGAFEPPHLVGGNPLTMRRKVVLLVGDDDRPRAFGAGFRGLDRHPHVCRVRTAEGDTDLARQLLRAVVLELPSDRPVVAPVRSYEEHVARALIGEGFVECATTMLFVKELAVRVEEPALAPATVR